MSDILWVAIMRSEIRSPTTKALSPILHSHLPRRYPHRHEPCVTNHSIGNERMNRSVSEDIRSWVLLTPMDEAFVLCFCDHGKPRAVAYTLGEQTYSDQLRRREPFERGDDFVCHRFKLG